MPERNQRFVALDIHKSYVVVGAVNDHQDVVLHPRRVSLVQLADWARKHLQPTDAVVLEATANAWYVYDLLEPLVSRVVVAHPYHVKLIAASFVKTDKRDTLALARLLAANLIPAVWVPPPHVREVRALVAHRKRLVSQRSAAKNRLRSLLHCHSILPPAGNIFSTDTRDWWENLPVCPGEKLRLRQDLATIDYLSPLIDEVEAELARLSVSDPWADQVSLLIQLPGVALVNAMTILSAIGDISRFSTAKKLVGYGGLGASIHASGQMHRTGGITKQGRRELRTALIEAAWTAVRTHPHWRGQFDRLARRIGRQKAIVAIARKLLVVVWHVLSDQVVDRHAQPEAVARKLMTWGTRYGSASSQGLSGAAFVRHHLDRLGLGTALEAFAYGRRMTPLPASRAVTTGAAPATG